MTPRISIIVPVYKVEAYLVQCVESIRNQTFENIEIILVDDGSPDNCGDICDEYAKIDKRIRVIHKENGGLSSARNAGLRIAVGEYIGFVDSDDYIAPDMFEKLYHACVEKDVYLSACNYFYVYGKDVHLEEESGNICVLNSEDFFRKILTEDGRIEMVAWNKLYHKSVFEGMDEIFPEGKLFEDLGSMYKFVFAVKKIAYIDIGLYFYRRFRPGAITSTQFNSREIERIEMGNNMTEYIRQIAPGIYRDALAFKFVNAYLSCVNSMVVSGSYDNKIYEYIRNDLKQNKMIIMKSFLPLWKKIQLLICSMNFKVYCFFVRRLRG